MRKPKRNFLRETAQRILWDDREVLLPHLMSHHSCPVGAVVRVMCEDAGWSYESYFLAIFFDHRDLITETGPAA